MGYVWSGGRPSECLGLLAEDVADEEVGQAAGADAEEALLDPLLAEHLAELHIGDSLMFAIGAAITIACGVIIPIILNEKVFKKYSITKVLFGLK